MGCVGCTVSVNGDQPSGCGSKGNCSTGGCNRLNTFDWLSRRDIEDAIPFDVVEISFKNGSRKQFFRNPLQGRAITGDMVVVESGTGLDVGHISLSGELVRLQMKKKRVREDTVTLNIVRIANERDIQRLGEARALEKPALIAARAISRSLGLDMKIGDVEYQGDRRKATFYYTADGRVDFRELIRQFAKEFRVKIEMRQIGARQESAKIGGLGSCGRELCCSTWLTDFKSVSTAAARYQNLAINQAKLSGQCGRLKCCLNYELDTYLDALEDFPERADRLFTEAGNAVLVKTDIFKGIMYYTYLKDGNRGKFYPLPVARVKEIQKMNKAKQKPVELMDSSLLAFEESIDFGDVTGAVELPPEERKKRRRGSRSRNNSSRSNRTRPKNTSASNDKGDKKTEDKPANKKSNRPPNRKKRRGPRPSNKKPTDKK